MSDPDTTTVSDQAVPGPSTAPEPAPAPPNDKYAEALRRFSSDLRMTGQVYQSMLDRGVVLQRHHYDQLLKTFLDHHDIIGVRKLLDRMVAEGHDTDPALRWRIAISTARTGATASALEQIEALRREGIDAPDDLGPAIAGLHVSVGNLAAGRAVLRDLAARGIPGNDADYRKLFEDCVRRRAINDSLDLLATMKSVGRIPDARQATELVRAIAAGGNPDRAIEVRTTLAEAGVAVGAPAHEAVLQGFLKQNQVREARLELERMEAAGLEATSHVRNLLAIARINSLDADKAWQVVEELGALPSSATLETLLTKTVNAKNHRRALGIIDWMLMLGVPVPVDGAGKVIDGLVSTDLDTAVGLVRELRTQDVPLDRRAARRVLDALSKHKRLDEAVALLDELRTAKSLTRAGDHVGVFAGLVRSKRVEDAMALFDRMLAGGVRPKSAEASRFVGELVKVKQFDRARGILDVLVESKVTVDEPTYRALLWAFAQANDEAGAKAIFDRMVAAGITPDDRHNKALAWASGDVRRKLSDKEIAEAEEKLRAEIEAEPVEQPSVEEPARTAAPATVPSPVTEPDVAAAEPHAPAAEPSPEPAPAQPAPAPPPAPATPADSESEPGAAEPPGEQG